jgi:uncharacterized membrane protein YsdA (DUF1294 family)
MQAYRKSFVVQMILFVIFFLMGGNIILSYYFGDVLPWLNMVILVLLITLGVYGFTLYRKKDDRIVIVTPKEIALLKYLLYGYFGVYLANMLLGTVIPIPLFPLFTVVVGIILMLTALYGIYVHYRILKVEKK